MPTPGAGEERRPEDQILSTPEEVAGQSLTTPQATRGVESLGVMPLLLGVVSVVMLALLLFGGDTTPDQTPEARTPSQSAPK